MFCIYLNLLHVHNMTSLHYDTLICAAESILCITNSTFCEPFRPWKCAILWPVNNRVLNVCSTFRKSKQPVYLLTNNLSLICGIRACRNLSILVFQLVLYVLLSRLLLDHVAVYRNVKNALFLCSVWCKFFTLRYWLFARSATLHCTLIFCGYRRSHGSRRS